MDLHEVRDAIELAKENHKKLSKCFYHEFEDLTPTIDFGKRFKCKNCQGEIDHHAYHWFAMGVKQATLAKRNKRALQR